MLFRIIFSFRIIGNNAATGIVAEVCHGRQPAHAQCSHTGARVVSSSEATPITSTWTL